MLPNTCRFCEHSNPEGAKFCTECGGCLHLLPCPSCGAVTDVSAHTCYQCKVQLPWHKDASATPPPSPVEDAKTAPRWRAPAIYGATVIILVAVLGYFGYRQYFAVNMQQPPAAGSQADASDADSSPASPSTPIRPASVRRDEPARATISADTRAGAKTAIPAPQKTAPAAVAPANNPVQRSPAATPRTSIAGAAPLAASPVATETNASEKPPSAGCTAAVAALNLCTQATPRVTHTQRRE